MQEHVTTPKPTPEDEKAEAALAKEKARRELAQAREEIKRLRAQIEKQREATYKDSVEIQNVRRFWDHAVERIEAALALHTTNEFGWCEECYDRNTIRDEGPCPTVKALTGGKP